jgi:uncharacterized repeat protein (TIGR01451 family)
MKLAIFRFAVVAAIAALMVVAGSTWGWATACPATFPNFTPDFSTNQSCLALNGAQYGTGNTAYPTFLTTNPSPGVATVMRLTPNDYFWSASAWFTAPQPVSSRFSTTFQFQLSNGSMPPADGIAFVIQNSPSGTLALDIGGSSDGCGLGFGEQVFENGQGNCTPGSGGIPNSVAVEFDTFQNTDIADVSNNHVAIQSCGANPNTVDSTCRLADNDLTKLANPINMADGHIHTATINYAPATMSGCGDGGAGPCPANIDVVLDGVDLFPGGIAFDMSTINPTNGTAYVGFSAGTGGSYEDQDILSWTFTSITGQPMNPNNPANLTQPFVFNNTTGEQVEFDFDYTTSFNNNDLTVVDNTVPTVADQCVTQATYGSMVAGTSLATTSCLIAPGQGTDSQGNSCCAQFTLECTNANSSSPAGDNCPQSSQRNLLFSHVLDISPALTTVPAGTAPSLAEGSDTWSPGNCIFEGPEAGNLCPQSVLTQFFAISSDPKPGGTTKTSNSTFIAGCCQPEWSTAPTVPQFYNSTTVPVSFISSPPAAPSPNPNNFVAAPNQSITWGWEGLGQTPDPTFPVLGDQIVVNSTACPSNWPTVGTIPPNATASGTVTVPSEGQFEVHFFSTACDAQDELRFTVQTNPNTNWGAFKTAPFNVDTTKPVVSSVALNPPGGFYAQNASATATVTCTDPSSTNSVPPNYFSGIAQCGQQGSPQMFANPQTITTTPIALNTATLGTQMFTAIAQDAAGNYSTAAVSYTVVGSADLAVGMIGNLLVKSGTNMTYLIGVANNGPNAADLVTLSDVIPAGTTFVSSGYAVESCSFSSGRPNCNISPPTSSCGNVAGSCSIGALPAWTKKNPIGVLVQVTVHVNASPNTTIKNTATTGEANGDPNLSNDTAVWYTLVTH